MADVSLQSHLQECVERAKADRADRLIARDGIACIDGRKTHPALCVPGGSAGLFLVLCAALEEVRGQELTDQDLKQLLKLYLNNFRAAYFHSDESAVRVLGGLHDSLQGLIEQPDTDAVVSVLRSLSESGFESVLGYLIEPELIGCGHLKTMTRHSDEYKVRGDLPGMVLSAFYRRLRAKDFRVRFEVLAGGHAEEGLVYITQTADSQGVLAPVQQPMPPRHSQIQLFMFHPQTSDYVLEEQSQLLFRTGWLSSGQEKDFKSLQTEFASKWMGITVGHLAPDAPVYSAEFGAEARRRSL